MVQPIDWLKFQASFEFEDGLLAMMRDRDRWRIEGERVIHDTSLWLEVDHITQGNIHYVLHIGLGDSAPIQMTILVSSFDYAFNWLVQGLRTKESGGVLDQIKVLVALSADAPSD